ncbi:kelch repeat-containing protein [Melittangium boletus]|uniref:kelch repeat-containing protein n=1 Tax=Melittangium boletus TaxID=83453 RepID=UPI003DA32BAF
MTIRAGSGSWKRAGLLALTALTACSEVQTDGVSGPSRAQAIANDTAPAVPESSGSSGPSEVAPTDAVSLPPEAAVSTPAPAAADSPAYAEQQWAWTGGSVLPEHKQVMMTPIVVDVNKDGVPDIVFSTFAGSNYSADGVIRAISGSTGKELWAATDKAARVKAAASLAAGDIDGDGRVEICGIPENGRGILCIEHDGTFKFRSAEAAYDYNEWGGPSLADLDGDGTVEILDGNRVYSNTGALKWVGSDGMGGALYTGPISFAADIDQDGLQEVINGRAVYRHDGSLKCANTSIPHGFAGVGNFDEDPAAEIVVAGNGKVSLLDDDCSLLWTRDVHITGRPQAEAGHGGPPNIADFDGDGKLDIGLSGDWNYTVYGAHGAVKWTYAIQDYSSGKTTSTTFDFEADGRLEVVLSDETRVRIFDGRTGALRWETRNSSGTTHENPIIVDVDKDGSAEIIVAANNHAYPGFNGIRVFRDPKDEWVGTRGIWNQHAYSITNVNDDGTIPAHPAANWLTPGLNTFRSQAPGVAALCRVKGTWSPTGSLALPRLLHTSSLLQDGRVLTAGGFNTTSEVYNAETGTWSRTGDTLAPHRYHSMTRLTDGRVLIAGGGTCPKTGATSELYSPDLGRWRPTGNLVVFRTHHTATLLPNGKVLVTGGEDTSGVALSSVELFDPATGTWSLAGNLKAARRDHSATLLPNGKVLLAGGGDDTRETLGSAEVYDPATGGSTSVGALVNARRFHSATLLPTGKVLVAGGGDSYQVANSVAAELYDPATGSWKATGSMATPRRFHSATLLPNGKVLAAGGYHQATGILWAAELYNPVTGTWCPAGKLNVDRYGHTATLLDDGRVLATAGVSNTDQSSAEVFALE